MGVNNDNIQKTAANFGCLRLNSIKKSKKKIGNHGDDILPDRNVHNADFLIKLLIMEQSNGGNFTKYVDQSHAFYMIYVIKFIYRV